MKIALLTRNPKLFSHQRLMEAAAARGHEIAPIDYLRCYMNITSRKPEQGEKARQFISARFNVQVESTTLSDPSQLAAVLDGAEVLLNSGPAGVQMVSKTAWTTQKSLKVAVDLNAAPPLGIEGVDVNDAGVERNGVICFGAFGVGNLKTKLHKRCVGRLFESNKLVLDAEAIAEIAREMK